ncbi:carbohydrate ABC transporter permease [Streptomyces lydicus]|uniref:carbohydrate ABC transporter permease n=1 Tax=Streptomyces lydicus TaxID=47763 RepID=UPI0037207CB2
MVGAAYAVRRRTPLAGTDLEPENGRILFFFVDPAHRRGGLGRRLLTDALQWLRGHGRTRVCFAAYAPHYVLPGLDRAAYPVYCEAAELDGAGRGTVFRRITLPLLRPSLLFVCLTQFIAGLQSFALINVMAGDGGPGDATNAPPWRCTSRLSPTATGDSPRRPRSSSSWSLS